MSKDEQIVYFAKFIIYDNLRNNYIFLMYMYLN